MTPINEVPVGKFCRMDRSIVYVCKNNFKDNYMLAPLVGLVPQDKIWHYKVYVYKRIKKEWATQALGWIELLLEKNRIDNLTYIENLDILKKYRNPVIVVEE